MQPGCDERASDPTLSVLCFRPIDSVDHVRSLPPSLIFLSRPASWLKGGRSCTRHQMLSVNTHATPPKLPEISNELSYPGALAPALCHQPFPFSGTGGMYRRALVVLTRPDRYEVDAEVSLLDGTPARIAVIWPVHLQKQ